MRYIRFLDKFSMPCQGLIEGDRIDLIDGDPLGGYTRTGVACGLDEIDRYLPPVSPPNIIAVGLNYADHVKEFGNEVPERPCLFIKAGTSLTGHRCPILIPAIAPDHVDFEAELAIVIGKKCKHVAPDRVGEVIFGYTIANDVTARDVQKQQDAQWARAKSFDSFCPVGPWIETGLCPDNLAIRSILNGRVMQDSRTSHFIFSVPELVSFISRNMTLLPGTLILTGTPPGVGFARTPRVNLKPGDTISIEIEGLGRLDNPVTPEPEPRP